MVAAARAGLEPAARALCDDVSVVGAMLRATFREPAAAAAAALTMRDSVPGSRFAVLSADAATAEAVERALALLAAVPDAIVVDRETASRLDARFELRERAGSWVLAADRTAVRPSSSTRDDGLDDPELALVRWGMRFADGVTERAYRTWHRDNVVPFMRVGMVASVVSWLMVEIALLIAHPTHLVVASVAIAVQCAMVCSHFATMSIARLRSWMLPGGAFLNTSAGCLGVALAAYTLDLPAICAGAATIVLFTGFTVLRLPIVLAMIATVPYLVFDEVLLVHYVVSGEIGRTAFILYTLMPTVALVVAASAGAVLERLSHTSYRQERIIEAQQRAIARERDHVSQLEREAAERDKRLLEAEVRRQVAERARDLSEAIARLSDAPATRSRLAPGDMVDTRYRIVRPIGEGGMGQVLEVERLADNRRLALKVLSHAADRSSLARFAREAQLAAELDHPNVIAALDVGVTGAGVLYLVMQLVTGASLDRARARYGDRAWALPILRQIGEAVVAMHERGIIHRDLKPSNVLLDGERVKVTDFGIASLVARPLDEATPDGATALALTRAGALVGTPSYMAPELCAGTQEAGPASDAFSLGVVAYELLAGRLPHVSPPAIERLAGRALAPPPPLAQLCPELPSTLAALVDRCLCEAPGDRPTMRALVDGLG